MKINSHELIIFNCHLKGNEKKHNFSKAAKWQIKDMSSWLLIFMISDKIPLIMLLVLQGMNTLLYFDGHYFLLFWIRLAKYSKVFILHLYKLLNLICSKHCHIMLEQLIGQRYTQICSSSYCHLVTSPLTPNLGFLIN